MSVEISERVRGHLSERPPATQALGIVAEPSNEEVTP
jgi:hypothetical protein